MMKKISVLILLIFGSIVLPAQKPNTFTMKGIVVDVAGEAFEGVAVYVKDKVSIGTQTDSKGAFTLKVTRGDMIVFNFVGMTKVEHLVLEEKQDMVIELKEETEQMDEVVVSALAPQRKITQVGAITTVDVSTLQTPAPSIANLLGGRVAGVISLQTSGEPGKNIADFWIRGIGTFGASSGALVLIDGLEGNINSIDPADIESFSVLKDASATAVYGVRGANGVVLVSTKKGQEGKLQITGRANFSISQLQRLPKYIGAYDYALLTNEAMEVRGEKARYDDIEMLIIKNKLDPDMYPDVNWQDEIVNPTSFKQTYYANVRGGGHIARYFVSLALNDETAAYNVDKNVYSSNVGYNTYNYRINVNVNITKTTEVYLGSDGNLAVRTEPGMANTDYIWSAQSQINPLMFPKVYSNGKMPAAGSNDSGLASPYVMINSTGNNKHENYQGKVTLAVNQDLAPITEGLRLRMQGAYDMHSMHSERRFIQPPLYRAIGRDNYGELKMQQIVAEQKASFSRGENQYRKYHFESTLTYDSLFGRDHRTSGLVYFYLSDQQRSSDGNTGRTAIPVRYQGLSSRLTYNFRDTYMLDVNFGYTGSENFQPGRQYGFFPSIAGGWIPTNYDLVKKLVPWLNFLKIRGSYGVVGNDRLAGNRRFPYQTLLNEGRTGPWGSNANLEFVHVGVIGADNLEWEKAMKADLGIEGRFWKDKISFVVDFFSDMRNGIFQPRVQVPYYAGLVTQAYGNIGKMRSFGADGNLDYKESINKDMSFIIRANFTYSRNMIYNWEQLYERYPYLEQTGYPNGSIRGYRSLGLFKDEDDVRYSPRQNFGDYRPGDIKYMDVNGDGRINGEDVVPLSRNTFPMIMYGFGGEFRYKEFTIGVMLKGTGKTDYFRVGQGNGMGYIPFYNGESGNVLTIAADPRNRWIPRDYIERHGMDPALAENPNAIFPRLQYGYNNNNSQLSDFWKGNSSYIRLQEITLNYHLKKDFLRRASISSVDIQLVGTNLYTWDSVKLFDPEQAVSNGRAYPLPAVYTLQFYINF